MTEEIKTVEYNVFDSVKIGLASPEDIRSWSYGEVTKAETLNYRTLKPERDGLFCEKIFGPTKDWECACGKYKRNRFKGTRCKECGVEITQKKVRRERMGHIELNCPVAHIWYYRTMPSKIGVLLDIPNKDLERVLNFSAYVVTDPGDENFTGLRKGQVLDVRAYNEARARVEDAFKVGMGAEAVETLLKEVDLNALADQIRAEAAVASNQRKPKLQKRLALVEDFRRSGNRPEWMILHAIPVLPPDIRPMVQLDGGRFAASDLNQLYQTVIRRNNTLKELIEKGVTPDVIIRNQKRLLQDAVDDLFDNGRRGKPVTGGSSNRPLKSLSEMLRGKQGRFRQNLLGKRVDYSGRSVIVVGPELKIYQCGLPKEMALELFKPFIMKRLLETAKATNIKDAKRKVERADPCVWDALEECIKEHPVLLNRAPTLHRLSIQAFEPVLVEGRAIKLHPLVCTAFNADFDGDQMPVHVPLSAEAQAEARLLMLSANNLLKPVDGKAVAVPSQDMVLGSYYLTIDKAGEPGEGHVYRDMDEALMAYQNGVLGLHAPIRVRITKLYEGPIESINGTVQTRLVSTTLGRLIFNQPIPQDLGFVDRTDPAKIFNPEIDMTCGKKQLKQIVDLSIKYHGFTVAAEVLDNIKAMGYKYSTKAAISISISDVVIPEEKYTIIADAERKVDEIRRHFLRGQLTEEERYKNVISIWEQATEDIVNSLQAKFDRYNPIKMMSDSGARGNMTQMRQLAGMRGLMFATNGRTMEIPIKSNFREGQNILDYFVAARGSRKSLSDTALKTADSGYLTRRLVDVSQDVIVRENDCGTNEGLWVSAILSGRDREDVEVGNAIDGRAIVSSEEGDVHDPATGEIIVPRGTVITDEVVDRLLAAGVKRVTVTSSADVIEPLADRLIGRFTANSEEGDVIDPKTGKIIVPRNTMMSEEDASAIIKAGIERVKIRSLLNCRARHGVCAHCYGSDLSNGRPVQIGEAVGTIAAQSIGEPGTQLTMRTFHTGGVASANITQGLPRVEELFEARNPKKSAIVAEQAGVVSYDKIKNMDTIVVTNPDTKEEIKYPVPFGLTKLVRPGDFVVKGQGLTEGFKKPGDILRIMGLDAVYDYIIREVQKVYRSQSIDINDRHIEVIARQMTRKVTVTDPGSTALLAGEPIDAMEFEDAKKEIQALIDAGQRDLMLPQCRPELLGITKASINTTSFLSAASFQETTRVLTNAAIKGKTDNLLGLKENVLIGKLIPAGTGLERYRSIEIVDKDGYRVVAPDPLPKPKPVIANVDAGLDDADDSFDDTDDLTEEEGA